MVLPPFARNLKALREEAGLTKKELAASVGVDASALVHWEKGRTANPGGERMSRLAAALAEALGRPVSVEALFAPGRSSGPESPIPAQPPTEYRIEQVERELKEVQGTLKDLLGALGGARAEPRHDAVRLDAGGVGDADPRGGPGVPSGEHDADTFILKVRGDCLAPDIEPGDILEMSRTRRANVADVVSVWVNGERQIKVVLKRDGALLLMSRRGELTLPAEGAELEGVMIGDPYRMVTGRRIDIRTALTARWWAPTERSAAEARPGDD